VEVAYTGIAKLGVSLGFAFIQNQTRLIVARCKTCGTFILFGGVRDDTGVYCNATCSEAGFIIAVAERLGPDEVAERLQLWHSGSCPRCGGDGPVDVHTSHRIWSALFMTSWNSRPDICCRRCGFKSKLGGIASSALLGWWGFPWGLLGTPIQISRNLFGLAVMPNPSQPSAQLEKMVRLNMAAEMLAEDEAEQGQVDAINQPQD
jgi:hypothetical protein